MTNFTKRMMIAAATLVVAAGAASAQTMKAEIPFNFRAGGTVMTAGTYQIGRILGQSGTAVFRLKDDGAGRPIVLLPIGARDAQKSWEAAGRPVLSFECVANRCELSGIWEGRFAPAYTIRHNQPGKEEPVRVALIEMRPDKSE